MSLLALLLILILMLVGEADPPTLRKPSDVPVLVPCRPPPKGTSRSPSAVLEPKPP